VVTDTLGCCGRNYRPHSAGRRAIEGGTRRNWNEPARGTVRMQPVATIRSTGCNPIARPSNSAHSTRQAFSRTASLRRV
jgi:hypothetical protein